MITSRSEFDSEMRKIDELVDRNATLPEQVFRPKASAFYVIDFDQLWSEEFFSDTQRLTVKAGDTVFTFAVLNPDPDSYYYAAFGKFPFLRFTNRDAADSYVTALHDDPGGSPADAIAYNSDVIVIYPRSQRWVIYGDRNLEIGIVAAIDDEMATAICATSQSLKFFTPAEAVRELLPPVYRGIVPAEVRKSLIENYSSAAVG